MSEQECVIAVYNELTQAREAVEMLREGGVPVDNISLATKTLGAEGDVREAIEYGDDMERDAAIGAGAGVVVGLLSAATVAAVTGVGTFLLAGPVLASGIVGSLLGASVGWGVHHDHIPEYERQLQQGKTLVIAHGGPLQVSEAESILQQTAPRFMRLHARSSADAADIG